MTRSIRLGGLTAVMLLANATAASAQFSHNPSIAPSYRYTDHPAAAAPSGAARRHSGRDGRYRYQSQERFRYVPPADRAVPAGHPNML
jgi:hypothetical protein